MAKKNDAEQVATITATGQIAKLDRAAFDAAEGEVYAGLNLLKLEIGQADGPFILTEVLADQHLNDKFKSGVDVYVAKRCDRNGAPVASTATVRMPASASFAQKCRDDAKLAIGDVFAVARDADYSSRQGRDDCKAYALKVFKRSGEAPALTPLTNEARKALREGSKAKK
jgi:hypothetical protein